MVVITYYGPLKKAQNHSAGDEKSYTYIAQRVAKLKWKWAGHIVRRRWTLGFQGVGVLVGPQRGGQTKSNIAGSR
ncbi:jg6246 [Pararge aegeria aegeria]|uniref:Jg6246 protein n=1 Tax=Pararge aegeria aegeria TaxID=348720 RepID=A0A8S4SDG1_9NEOP|nr:jg6246 [Pararge aegeria aegeria]